MALSAAGVAPATLAAAFGGIGLAIGLGLKDNIGNVASGILSLFPTVSCRGLYQSRG